MTISFVLGLTIILFFIRLLSFVLSSIESYALIENAYFFEFRDRNSPNVRITKLSFSDEDLNAKYENINNWSNHKDIYEKYNRVKKFFKLQEEFLNQLK